jgi:hypothetical protein
MSEKLPLSPKYGSKLASAIRKHRVKVVRQYQTEGATEPIEKRCIVTSCTLDSPTADEAQESDNLLTLILWIKPRGKTQEAVHARISEADFESALKDPKVLNGLAVCFPQNNHAGQTLSHYIEVLPATSMAKSVIPTATFIHSPEKNALLCPTLQFADKCVNASVIFHNYHIISLQVDEPGSKFYNFYTYPLDAAKDFIKLCNGANPAKEGWQNNLIFSGRKLITVSNAFTTQGVCLWLSLEDFRKAGGVPRQVLNAGVSGEDFARCLGVVVNETVHYERNDKFKYAFRVAVRDGKWQVCMGSEQYFHRNTHPWWPTLEAATQAAGLDTAKVNVALGKNSVCAHDRIEPGWFSGGKDANGNDCFMWTECPHIQTDKPQAPPAPF